MDQQGAPTTHRFGRFEFAAEQRLLAWNGRRLTLSSRAFDILGLLIEQRHRVVTKDEIISVVWRGMAVDDNNLAVQISALRRTLARHAPDPVVATVPGQGYRFVGMVEAPAPPPGDVAAGAADDAPAVPPSGAPAAVRRWRRPALAACACVLAACAIGVAYGVHRRDAEAPRLSVAVLPFRDLSDDRRQGYLADAITDDLTTDLSHIPGSKVIARESADSYRDRTVPTPAIGRALGVRYLLEGSLRREADTLHINAQLIEAASGAHVWANMLDVGRDGLATARSDIVRRLASVLDYTLVQAESARSQHDRPDDPDAMDFYLRARSVLDRGDDLASLQQAQALFERAIAAAPDTPDALAGLGSVLLRKIYNFDDADEWEDHARGQAVIGRALELSPRNAASVTASGDLALIDGHCDQARERFQAALSLQPGELGALKGLGLCDVQLGRVQQAIDEFLTVLRIDPAGPDVASRRNIVGWCFLLLGKPTEALRWLTSAAALVAPGAPPDTHLGWREWHDIYQIAALQMAGERDAAKRQYLAYALLHPNRTVWRLASYDSHAASVLPGHSAYREALHAAGMPMFTSEDVGAAEASGQATREPAGDFDPAPFAVEGAQDVTSQALRLMLQTNTPPLILDVGSGAAVIPGAVSVWPSGVWGDRNRMLLDAARHSGASRSIVVMGDAPFGATAYKAVTYLVAHGAQNVLWFRGGEELWAQAGFQVEDRRSP